MVIFFLLIFIIISIVRQTYVIILSQKGRDPKEAKQIKMANQEIIK